MNRKIAIIISCALLTLALTSNARAQQDLSSHTEKMPPRVSRTDILTPREWQNVDKSVDRALQWLLTQQQRDGSFLTLPMGQPGVTSLVVMAFLSAGHLPSEGPYAQELERAIDFVLRTQHPNGLLSYVKMRGNAYAGYVSFTAEYNHAIAGLMLGEVYGMCRDDLNQRIHPAIERGLAWTIENQRTLKGRPGDQGGWRYYHKQNQSDLSVTTWHIMFLRSAKNAQFDVPHGSMKAALGYVERCFDPRDGVFLYTRPQESYVSRGMVGGGILMLSLGSEHNNPMALRAGDWLLQHSFRNYNQGPDPYHYAAYYASQAMFQLGGKYWEGFYPEFSQTLVKAQRRDGSWERENHSDGKMFGRAYTTSLVVLALTPPYQLLPIYQR